jgi:hypothetical protein
MSPLLSRRRILAAAIETNPGEAETLDAADCTMHVFDPKITPDIASEERPGQGSLSPLAAVPGALGGTATFQTEIYGGETDPPWASVLLPACGYPGDGHVYSPLSEAPGTNVKTLTLGLYQDGRLFSLRGAVGTAVFRFPAGRPVRVEWTFKGIWVAPSDVALPEPTWASVSPLRFVSSGLAIGSWTPTIAELTIDLGNEVTLREDSRETGGYAYAVITGRRVRGTLSPEADLVDDKDVYGDWLARLEEALSIDLTDGAHGVSFDMPKFQIVKADAGDRGGVLIDAIEFQANRSADAGDDELVITVS